MSCIDIEQKTFQLTVNRISDIFDLTFRKCAVDYILGREEGQLSPPAFMSNESGLFNDQIAIWAIALASNRDHMIR